MTAKDFNGYVEKKYMGVIPGRCGDFESKSCILDTFIDLLKQFFEDVYIKTLE